jgi:hypothetical protein
MQILRPALHLIPHIRKLNLAPRLQPLLNRHLENPILRALPPRLIIIRLALDLELLRRAAVQLLEAHGQRLLHDRDFGLGRAPSACKASAASFAHAAARHAEAAAAATPEEPAVVVAAATAHAAVPHELGEYVVG